jgi:hypothetical protein
MQHAKIQYSTYTSLLYCCTIRVVVWLVESKKKHPKMRSCSVKWNRSESVCGGRSGVHKRQGPVKERLLKSNCASVAIALMASVSWELELWNSLMQRCLILQRPCRISSVSADQWSVSKVRCLSLANCSTFCMAPVLAHLVMMTTLRRWEHAGVFLSGAKDRGQCPPSCETNQAT